MGENSMVTVDRLIETIAVHPVASLGLGVFLLVGLRGVLATVITVARAIRGIEEYDEHGDNQ